MNRRSFLAGALALAAVPAAAEPAFKRLTPLLIDLPGFTGDKPDGMTMEAGDGAMTTAARKYKKDAASVEVAVVCGAMAQGVLAGVAAGLKIETSAGHMIASEIDGFRVVKSYNDNDKSGALIVALGKQTAMTFSYRGLPEDDAVALARKLDWKALAAVGQ